MREELMLSDDAAKKLASDALTANINTSCLKTVQELGHDVVYNVCAGTKQITPWGIVDWIDNIVLITAGACITVTALVGMAYFCHVVWEHFKHSRS